MSHHFSVPKCRSFIGRTFIILLLTSTCLSLAQATQAANSQEAGRSRVRQAAIFVTNTDDDGAGSLRQALIAANADTEVDTISFAISGTAPFTITPTSPLPAISGPVIINGLGEVILSGANAGLEITSTGGGSTIQGLTITGASGDGILINDSPDNTIGGISATERNIISGNGGCGIRIIGQGSDNTIITGNYIGTDATGTAALPNVEYGIHTATEGVGFIWYTTIGGTAPGAGNLISGNMQSGVWLADSERSVIQGNLIGTNVTGTAAIPNGNYGVEIYGGGFAADPHVVGGTTAGARNIISGNMNSGVALTTMGSLVQGNYIGTDINGTAALPNGTYGLFLNSSNSVVGGTTAEARNLISGNTGSGMYIRGDNNTVQGNYIGTDVTGSLPLPNGEAGIRIENGSTTLAGTGVLANRIAYNLGSGIMLSPLTAGSFAQRLSQNIIYSNGGLGIDIDASPGDPPFDGVTDNDPGDTDTGANNLQNYPVVTVASTWKAGGTLDSTPDTTFTLEFYSNTACNAADPANHGEGETYLGSASVTTDATGTASFLAVFSRGTAIGTWITATATASGGGTSEFSECYEVLTAEPPSLLISDTTMTEGDLGTTDAVFTVTLTEAMPAAVTVEYDTAPGSAVAGSDYITMGDTLTFNPGDPLTQTIEIPVIGDGVVEPDETFTVILTNAFNAAILDDTGTGTILNNDVTPVMVTSITLVDPTPTSNESVRFTVTFNEAVTGVTTSNFAPTVLGSLGGAIVDSVAGMDDEWTVTVLTGSGEGTLRLDMVDSTGVTNAEGNPVSVPFTSGESYTIDRLGPTVTVSSSESNPTNASPIVIDVTFAENVTGFTLNGVTVTGGTKGNLNGIDAAYTFEVTPSGDPSDITVDVLAGAALDELGNPSQASSQPFTIRYSTDVERPSVTLSSTSADPTNTSPIPIAATFSEDVTGFETADITVTNGTAGPVSGSGTDYTFDVTPTSAGTVTVTINDGAAQDLTGNLSTPSDPFSIDYDNVSPGGTISSTASNPTDLSPIPITAAFDEVVTGLDEGEIVVVNGSVVVGSLSGSGTTTYTFTIAPTGDPADITVDIAAGAAQDAAGNPSLALAQFAIRYSSDITRPGVAVSSSASDPTNTSPIPITVTFTEAVTGFDGTDVTVTNGTAGLVSGSGAVYTFDVTPASAGTVTVTIIDSAAQDAAGNLSTPPAAPFTILYDNIAPGVTISSTASNPTDTSPIPIRVTFDEQVLGFEAADITVTGGTAGTLTEETAGLAYTFDITPSGDPADITVDIAAGAAQDAAGNPTLDPVPNPFAIRYSSDITRPGILTLGSTAPNPTNTSPIPMTVTFSETVTGFETADITVTNGTAGLVSGSGAVYTFDVTPASAGTVTVTIIDSAAQDAAGNLSTPPAAPFTILYDNIAPGVTISSTAPAVTNVSPIPIRVTFDEPVTGFEAADITVTGGTAGTLTEETAGLAYTFDITPSGDPVTVTVNIANGAVQDAAGNLNGPVAEFTIRYSTDITPPEVVSITSTAPDPTNTSPIPVAVTFTESVADFAQEDLVLANANVSNFNGSGTSYTFDLTPLAAGSVTVTIPAGTVHDASGNANTLPASLSRVFDNLGPVPTLTTTAPEPTALPIPVTLTFSKPVTDFEQADIRVDAGSTVSNFVAASSTQYTFTVTRASAGAITVDIDPGVAHDTLGNANVASTQLTRTFDNVAPTVTINQATTQSDPTNTTPVFFTVVFSEPVIGFATGDVTLGGTAAPTIAAVSGSGTTYTVQVSGTGGYGTITAALLAGVAADSAGNASQASTSTDNTITYTDASVPSVMISPASLTITENAAGQAYTVRLGSVPQSGEIVTITITPSGAGITVNPTSLTFTPANWNTPASVTVTAPNNTLLDGTRVLSVNHGVSSNIPTTPYGNGSVTAASVSVTVQDDDSAGLTIVETGNSTLISEAGPTFDTYTIALNTQPAAGETVTVTVAFNSTQMVVSPFSLQFTSANWNTPRTVTVTAVDDTLVETNPHTLPITHSASSTLGGSPYSNVVGRAVNVSITENETSGSGTILLSSTALSLSEPSGTGVFIVRLGSAPTAAVTIKLSVSDETECLLNGLRTTTLTLDAQNWSNGVSVTVNSVDDTVSDGSQPCLIITDPAASTDSRYQGVNAENVTVTVSDNEAPGATAEDHARAQAPLCSSPSGTTNVIVRADVPTTTITWGYVYCRVIVENGTIRTSENIGGIGIQQVLDMGVKQAVDVFGMSGPVAIPRFNNSIRVCLQGTGRFLYLDALTSPRTVNLMPSTAESGYVCATIPNAGTVVLVP